MKMYKLLALVLAAALLLSFAACGKKESPTVITTPTTISESSAPPETTTIAAHQPSYTVHLSQVSDSGIFSSDTSVVSLNSVDFTPDAPEKKSNTVKVNGVNVPLTYEHSSNNYHRFVSDDGLIKCNFHYQSGKLLQISIRGGSAAPERIDTEEQYVAWAKQLVSAFVTEDWDDYVYNCETVINTSTETYSENDKYNTFVNETKENEEISSYSFYFTRYVNGMATSDRIHIYVGLLTGTVIVKFDRHEFDTVKGITIDTDVINQRIKEFLTQSLTDDIILNDYVLKNPTLTVVNGKYYLQYTVSLNLAKTDNPDLSFVSLEILLVEV